MRHCKDGGAVWALLTGGSDYHGTLEAGSSELGSQLATEAAISRIFSSSSSK